MEQQILIAGGGIGGLAAALACAKAGWPVQLLERSTHFGEVGAGIQLGPNVVRILQDWGLESALREVAAFPEALVVRDSGSGEELGRLRLGERTRQQYGAPYATIHRAGMHQLLMQALQSHQGVQLSLDHWVESFQQGDSSVAIHTKNGIKLEGAALIGADGLWSSVRQQLLQDGPPRVSGHLAYRAMVNQSLLPERLRSQQVTVWLGPHLHLVQYPVRAGKWLNVVGIVHGHVDVNVSDWDHVAHARDLRAALVGHCGPLQDLVGAVNEWRLWALCDRPPMQSAGQQAKGRVALLGDAAHPMRPYMAQGAGMAIEDAACLQQVLSLSDLPMEKRLQRYAQQRWQRNAKVQARSIRNGEIFHATGLMRWGRNLSMKLLGESLLDVPWLYRGPRH